MTGAPLWRERPARLGALLAVLVAVLAAVLLATSACTGGASSDDAAPGPGDLDSAVPGTTGASPAGDGSASAGTKMTSADLEACSAVQTDFLRLAGVSARWDRAGNPFDASVGEVLTTLSSDLRGRARSASTPQLRVLFDRSADAVGALAAAIATRQQERLDAALEETRAAYRALPRCARRPGDQALPAGTPGQPVGTSSAPAGPAVDPGCGRVRGAYATIGSETSGWSIEKDPFDQKAADSFASGAEELRAAAADVEDPEVRDAVDAAAAAFDRLSAEMAGHHRAGVDSAIIAIQHATAAISTLCPSV